MKGSGITDGTDADIAAAVAAAGKADLVVLALGENAGEMTGEAASRAHLNLPGRQQELLEKVVAAGKPVVLIIFSGRPLTLPWAFEHVPAVIAAWFPGIQAGPALVRTLYGESNPSGRLVVSWPRTVGQEPLYYNALSTGRPSVPGSDRKFVSRYIDEESTPQFPFGFGLSYSTFQYGATEINSKTLKASQLRSALNKKGAPALTATAAVTNSGSVAGEEVVQLYVRLEGTSTAQPVRALKGFQRVSLAPGETKKVTFNLAPRLSLYGVSTINSRWKQPKPPSGSVPTLRQALARPWKSPRKIWSSTSRAEWLTSASLWPRRVSSASLQFPDSP